MQLYLIDQIENTESSKNYSAQEIVVAATHSKQSRPTEGMNLVKQRIARFSFIP